MMWLEQTVKHVHGLFTNTAAMKDYFTACDITPVELQIKFRVITSSHN